MKRIILDEHLNFKFLVDFFQLDFQQNQAEGINNNFFSNSQNSLLFANLQKSKFKSLCNDTRQMQKGDMFFALDGLNSKGKDFIAKAIDLSASLVFVQSEYLKNSNLNFAKIQIIQGIFVIEIANLQQKIGDFLAQILQINSQNLGIYAITGTNGKTSVAHFLAQIWQILGFETRIIGTLGNGSLKDLSATDNTTPDIFKLYNLLFLWRKNGVKKVVMEASSHALYQNRLAGLKIKTAIFTNLTQDHLDYHKNMQNYGAAKKLLFTDYQAKNAVFNLDDSFGQNLFDEFKTKIASFGFSKKNSSAEVFLQKSSTKNAYLEGEIFFSKAKKSFEFSTKIIGSFNFDNLLAVCASLLAENIKISKIAQSLNQLNPVLGRMELLSASRFFEKDISSLLPKVVIDYAHTPDALEKALLSIEKQKGEKLICVFGAGGDRDKSKRPLMGEISSKIANIVYITDDNPRSEDPAQIRQEIKNGAKMQNSNIFNCAKIIEEGNRKKAIFNAIEKADAKDWILIAGKGNEDYQIIGDAKTHFSDREEALEALQKLALNLVKNRSIKPN